MEVSTHLPALEQLTLEPFPRWQVMTFALGLPSSSRARPVTYLWEVPVEAVTAYLIVLVCLVGQSVHIMRLLHGHAPAGIEYRYHGYAGHNGHAAADAP